MLKLGGEFFGVEGAAVEMGAGVFFLEFEVGLGAVDEFEKQGLEVGNGLLIDVEDGCGVGLVGED
ncbi:MAG: hypothetical protein CMF28_00590 [Kiritimatiellaceae bacterium]|nr:hypothetical protein [Kiritimatiellaceae bacterium]